jgi:aminoglycoside 3-N-acetyltransferase
MERLTYQWRAAGINTGDVVLIHSNISRTIRSWRKQGIQLDPQSLLESFISAVGESGTVVLPLFNFDFPKTASFDIRNTPSQMGALTEAARLDPRSVRTGHPIYSFAAIGAQAGEFRNVDNFSGYAGDSPFGILRKLGGKIGVLDLPDQSSMTFYHHVEEMNEVPYRYHKTFTGRCTDEHGVAKEKTYGLFVRNLENNVLTHVDPAGDLMWESGLYRGHRPGDGPGFRTVDANAMFDFVTDIIDSGRAENLLFRYDQ